MDPQDSSKTSGLGDTPKSKGTCFRGEWKNKGRIAQNLLKPQNSIKVCIFKVLGSIDKGRRLQEKKVSTVARKLGLSLVLSGRIILVLTRLILLTRLKTCEEDKERESSLTLPQSKENSKEDKGTDLYKKEAKLQTKTPKRLKEDKEDEAKDDEPTKKPTKRRKQIARKGMHTSVDENVSDDSDKVDELVRR
ncbi:hypothetical protein Tco_0509469 [Tanacetum coccineum]